uniref:Uncharacterized protein n=1 Tax=Anguilla anguilla TaxID=7936 RepID=A0A0E9X408_ANGAN
MVDKGFHVLQVYLLQQKFGGVGGSNQWFIAPCESHVDKIVTSTQNGQMPDAQARGHL